MNLIQDDELVFVADEVQLRIGQFGAVGGQFQVEITGAIALLASKHGCQRSLADLPGPKQGHRGKGLQRPPEAVGSESRDDHLAIMPHNGTFARSVRGGDRHPPPSARADGQGLRFDEVKEERGERATKFLRAIKMRLY